MINHEWFDSDENKKCDGSIGKIMYDQYEETCKKIKIEPKCTLNDFNNIIKELETYYASFKEFAEMENENDPSITYVLEEDENGELIVLEVHFKENGKFDVLLMLFQDE